MLNFAISSAGGPYIKTSDYRSPFQTMRWNISSIFAAGSFSMRSIHQRSRDSRLPAKALARAANAGFESLVRRPVSMRRCSMPRAK